MKRRNLLIILVAIILTSPTNAQIYIIGDTVGRFVYNPEVVIFDYDAAASVDINCDGSADLQFISHGAHLQGKWPILFMDLSNGTEVVNLNSTTRIHLFDPGDTLHLNEDIWYHPSNVLWGLGELGGYGLYSSDSQYVAFRIATKGDTSYAYLKISHEEIWLNIHQIISECPDDPLTLITATEEATNNHELRVFPNPFSNQLTFEFLHQEAGTIYMYDASSKLVLQQQASQHTTINVAYLPKGVYQYYVKNAQRIIAQGKIVKYE